MFGMAGQPELVKLSLDLKPSVVLAVALIKTRLDLDSVSTSHSLTMPSELPALDTLNFWQALDSLVEGSEIIIDRPAGSVHPRFPNYVYPLDYGYLRGTTAADGDGIDIWRGALPDQHIFGVIVTVDLQKRDSEMKILIGCTLNEMNALERQHNMGLQSGLLVKRPVEP